MIIGGGLSMAWAYNRAKMRFISKEFLMKQYLDLCRRIVNEGEWVANGAYWQALPYSD